MNLWLRMIRVVLRALLGQRLAPLDTSRVYFRVWPHDLDINLHMNNGRYLTLMDLGRLDLMLRTGMGRVIFQEKWMPVVATAMVRFKRSLLPFQFFRLESRVICWDEKWFYLEQKLLRGDREVAHAIMKGCIRRSGGVVPPAEIFERVLGEAVESPAMPDSIRHWQDSEESLRGGYEGEGND